MTETLDRGLSRRALLTGGGALIIAFSLSGPGRLLAQETQEGQNAGKEPRQPTPLPGSLKNDPELDSWIRVEPNGNVTVFTGKAELGQGIKTALLQVAAEELRVAPENVTLVTADTGRTPNEAYTAGSHSMQDSGTAIMNAAAQAREILIALAAERWLVPANGLRAENATIFGPDGKRLTYGDLIGGKRFEAKAEPESKLTDPAKFTIIGKPFPRVDIPAKVAGGQAYVHDLRLPGMVHGRVLRPPSYGATLRELDQSAAERMPGVLKIVRDGSYVAVVAEKEYQAITALRTLSEAARWDEKASLPEQSQLYPFIEGLPAKEYVILDRHDGMPAGARTIEATYHRPYQMHASIGPSCAVANFDDKGVLTVWTHSQGVFPLRKALAELLGISEPNIHCIHVEGSGCYGHNPADDVAADAALVAHAFPGRPVRVQWMRDQEHAWEPYGPAMITRARAALDASGTIVDWQYEVRSNTHNSRPAPAGNLMPAWSIAHPFTPPAPEPIPQPEGGGDRNSIPLYRLPNAKVVHQFVPTMPLRVSALRGLGAYMNVFSIESFMDELAAAADADPVEFRLRHLDDPRGRDVINMAAERFGWQKGARAPDGRGYGFAFARYKNLGAYAAIAVEVAIERETGRLRVLRAVAATDSGQAVNPDGIRNQIEGGILQATSWTLYEEVTFDRTRITSWDWGRYPIMRFPAVPESVEVHVIDRPGQPFLGTGEAAQGPTGAAIANAVANATGRRIRDLPFTPQRVKETAGL